MINKWRGINWLRFSKGFLSITIKGDNIEKFIDKIILKNIKVWKIRKLNDKKFEANIYACDFAKLNTIIDKSKYSVKINKKNGLPFIFNNIINEFTLIIGIIILFSVIWFNSLFMWTIEINGIESINESEIRQDLKLMNIKRGILKSSINLVNLENKLIRNIPEIVWVDAEWSGTKLLLQIVEKEKIKPESRSAVVARCSGIIKELILLQGEAVVKEGDTVIKGQPLILPAGEGKKATGIITAHIWTEYEIEYPILQQNHIKKHNVKNRKGLRFNNYELYFPPSKPNIKNGSTYISQHEIFKWRNLNLSIEFIKERYYLTEKIEYKYTPETATFLAKERAMEEFFKKIDPSARILNCYISNLDFNSDKNYVKLNFLIETEENIGIKKEDFRG